MDFFEVFSAYSYAGIFLALVGVNAVPLLMPPTWMILGSFYILDPQLDPLVLALVGATGATLGRLILKRYSALFRRFADKEHRQNLTLLDGFLTRRRYGYVLASFLFAATPLPSNMLFVAYGLMGVKSAGLYAGFWCGRVLSYYVMISISNLVFLTFAQLFEDRYVVILVADAIGIAGVILFASLDWGTLVRHRQVRFIRPRIWRL